MRITNCQLVDGVPMEMDGADGVTFRLLCGRDHGACTFAMRHFTVAPDGHTPPLPHIDCSGGAAAARERALDALHKFEAFQKMLHGVHGLYSVGKLRFPCCTSRPE